MISDKSKRVVFYTSKAEASEIDRLASKASVSSSKWIATKIAEAINLAQYDEHVLEAINGDNK